jgi:hypothetical protein
VPRAKSPNLGTPPARRSQAPSRAGADRSALRTLKSVAARVSAPGDRAGAARQVPVVLRRHRELRGWAGKPAGHECQRLRRSVDARRVRPADPAGARRGRRCRGRQALGPQARGLRTRPFLASAQAERSTPGRPGRSRVRSAALTSPRSTASPAADSSNAITSWHCT